MDVYIVLLAFNNMHIKIIKAVYMCRCVLILERHCEKFIDISFLIK